MEINIPAYYRAYPTVPIFVSDASYLPFFDIFSRLELEIKNIPLDIPVN